MATIDDLRTRLLLLLRKISVDELTLDHATWTLLFKFLKQHPKLLYRSRLTNSKDLMTSLFQLPVIEAIEDKFDQQSILHFKDEYIKYVEAELETVKCISNLSDSVMDLLTRLSMLTEILNITKAFKDEGTPSEADETIQEGEE